MNKEIEKEKELQRVNKNLRYCEIIKSFEFYFLLFLLGFAFTMVVHYGVFILSIVWILFVGHHYTFKIIDEEYIIPWNNYADLILKAEQDSENNSGGK